VTASGWGYEVGFVGKLGLVASLSHYRKRKTLKLLHFGILMGYTKVLILSKKTRFYRDFWLFNQKQYRNTISAVTP